MVSGSSPAQRVHGREQRGQQVVAWKLRPVWMRSEVAMAARSGGNAVWLTLMPMPGDGLVAGDLYQDAARSLRPPSIRSLGQRMSQRTPATVVDGFGGGQSQGEGQHADVGFKTIEQYRPEPAGECHPWPWRPWPAVCSSASTTSPMSRSAAARMVESMESIERGKAPRTAHAPLQAEADVHGASRVRDGAGRDEIGAGFGVGADGVEGDAAGEFDLGTAGDLAHPIGGFGGGEVVEQQVGGAAIERFAQLFPRAYFDLDGQAGGAGPPDGIADAAGRRDVIVLDQDGVVEAHAVVRGSAGRGGGLFERPHAGGGFARIEDAAAGAGHGFGVAACQGGHAAQALQEVQGNALACRVGCGRGRSTSAITSPSAQESPSRL